MKLRLIYDSCQVVNGNATCPAAFLESSQPQVLLLNREEGDQLYFNAVNINIQFNTAEKELVAT